MTAEHLIAMDPDYETLDMDKVLEELTYDNISTANVTNSTDNISSYVLSFNEDSIRETIIYSFLFALAAAGNVPVFISLLRNRRRKSRIKIMILHLSIADLIVTFVMIPLEISWRITVQWIAGDAACRIMLFMRAFGPYLSSMVLVCISLDRYFAIVHPLKVNDAQRRGKIMLSFAWLISVLCSIPQSVIFHVESHPSHPSFEQCVSFNFFPTDYHKVAYNVFCLLALYLVPLLIIVLCYSRILYEMFKRSRDTKSGPGEEPVCPNGRMRLRRSDLAHIERARARTLKMTVIIVLAFFCCWTPYVVMVLWYLVDPVSAEKVDAKLQSSLFMFAVSNSCVNPLVYGTYTLNLTGIIQRCFGRCSLSRTTSRQTSAMTRFTQMDNNHRVHANDCLHNLVEKNTRLYPLKAVNLKLEECETPILCKDHMLKLSRSESPDMNVVSYASKRSCNSKSLSDGPYSFG